MDAFRHGVSYESSVDHPATNLSIKVLAQLCATLAAAPPSKMSETDQPRESARGIPDTALWRRALLIGGASATATAQLKDRVFSGFYKVAFHGTGTPRDRGISRP